MAIKSALPSGGKGDDGKGKKVFRVWPDPPPGIPYGPQPKQRLLFIEDLPDVDTFLEDAKTGEKTNIRRPHYHSLDVICYIGGARSGKTQGAVGRAISYLIKNPGSVAIIGAINYPVLERTMLREWGERFKQHLPWDYASKKKVIVKKPTVGDKRCIFANGSIAYFVHLKDEAILRGVSADLILFEEATLIPDEESFEELGRRLSGRKGPIRQLILTTNPSARGNWLDQKFKLDQLRPTFTGEKEPLCPPCTCHLCVVCRQTGAVESEYVDGVCPECSHIKTTDCPGNQVYWRVIQTKSSDNAALLDEYVEDMRSFMDEKNYRVFVGGSTEDIRQGEVYKAFSDDNVYKTEQPISLEKDLIWTLDFNFEPQCSVIAQEEETSQGFVIKVLDEIVLWNALPEHAAEEFCRRPDVLKWKEAGRDVIIYGDPAGLYGTGSDLVPSFYKIITDVLSRHDFSVKLMMRKPPKNAVLKEPVRVPVAGRVDAVNMMLCHEEAENSLVDGVSVEENKRYIRMLINKKCVALIKSLREVRWSEDGKNMDKNCDRRAARSKNTNNTMTHPTDALGYYVYKRFPVVKNKAGVIAFKAAGGDGFSYDSERGFVDRNTAPSNRKLSREERLKERAKRKLKRAEEKAKREYERTRTIGGWLRSQGLDPPKWPTR